MQRRGLLATAAAAGLRGDADGASPLLGDVDALDRRAVVEAKQVFDGAVAGALALSDSRPAQLVAGLQPLSPEPAQTPIRPHERSLALCWPIRTKPSGKPRSIRRGSGATRAL